MAKIEKTKLFNSVYRSYLKRVLKGTACLAGAAGCVVMGFFTYGLSAVLALPLLYFAVKFFKNRQILHNGAEGEKQALKVLSRLPLGYTVLPDMRIKAGRCQNQLDMIVIGPGGVFAVEVKNHRGKITGRPGDEQWVQKKLVNGYKKTEKSFYSPVKQVQTHVKTLNWLLKSNRISMQAAPAVFFADPGAKVGIIGSPVPIFSARKNGAARLRRYICKAWTGPRLSQVQCDKIIAVIKAAEIK